jgi:hypothetical protein
MAMHSITMHRIRVHLVDDTAGARPAVAHLLGASMTSGPHAW